MFIDSGGGPLDGKRLGHASKGTRHEHTLAVRQCPFVPELTILQLWKIQQIGHGLARGNGGRLLQGPIEEIRLGMQLGVTPNGVDDVVHRVGEFLPRQQSGLETLPHLVGPIRRNHFVFHHPVDQDLHQLAGGDGNRMTILAFKDQGERCLTQLEIGPASLEILTLDRRRTQSIEHGPCHGALRRHINELRLPGLSHPGMRHQRGHGHLPPRMPPGLGNRKPDRRALGYTLERNRPRHGRNGQIRGHPIGVRAVRTEGREFQMNDLGLERLEGPEADPGLFQFAPRPRLQDEVSGLDQIKKGLPVPGLREIKGDGPLVAVVGVELQARVAALPVLYGGLLSPRLRTTGGLDTDDIGPEVPEHHARDLAPMIGQVKHAVRLQSGPGHPLLLHLRPDPNHTTQIRPPRWTESASGPWRRAAESPRLFLGEHQRESGASQQRVI